MTEIERRAFDPMRRRATLLSHPAFRRPGFGAHHPLSTMRQAAVLELIEALGWLAPGEAATAPLATRAVLERFHRAPYLDAFEAATAAGVATPQMRRQYNLGGMECPIFPGLRDRALASVGGAILAAELALAGHIAFHPGGGTHHGRPDRASGFCYFNDPVFAVLRLLDAGLSRVLYVDLDAHHCDGVEDAFAGDERVRLLSIHEEGRWPGTGGIAATPGRQACNIPVPRGFKDGDLAALRTHVVAPLLERLNPEAVVVTLGADGLAGDPLSAMELSNHALWQATEEVVAAAPVAVVLGGGGYNPWTTARLWSGMWARLSGRHIPGRLPVAAAAILAGLDSDLVETEDRLAHWTTTIADPVRAEATPARPRIGEIIAELARRPIRRWS